MSKRRPNITADDLMDADEVAEAFGVAKSSLQVAMSKGNTYPALRGRLPAPIRKCGGAWVWLRYDVEKAVEK